MAWRRMASRLGSRRRGGIIGGLATGAIIGSLATPYVYSYGGCYQYQPVYSAAGVYLGNQPALCSAVTFPRRSAARSGDFSEPRLLVDAPHHFRLWA
jgi:hypothetical protein